MNLTDQEILELNELCSALLDGRLTDEQRVRLERWLATSEAARRLYVRIAGQSASLHLYASEMHGEVAPAAPRRRRRPLWLAFGAGLAAAATIAVAFIWQGSPPPATPARPAVTVARISAVKDAVWNAGGAFAPGRLLVKGEQLELLSGYAEVTFDSGARAVLQGPATLTVNSAWDSTLRRGTVSATVPRQAIGFRISNPSVEIVDLGTEFTMVAGSDGNTEVFVLKGEIEASPRSGASEADVLLLREREARRFSRSGVSEVPDRETKFEHFLQLAPLERTLPHYRFAHWTFDDAEALGGTPTSVTGAPLRLAAGHHGRALRLEGDSYAQSSFPGISGAAPHTVAFWIRVPEDAPLSEAYSMFGWRSNLAKLSYRPVHISWNRNPNEGALGAIRTDFAGGCAIGSTSLRDGRWHHIAVVFVPGTGDTPVQVKQYVDGYLESSSIIPGRTRGPAGQADARLDDTLWIGSRLGATGPRQERFRGEIDELFVVEGALEPQEIVQLQQNHGADGILGHVAAR